MVYDFIIIHPLCFALPITFIILTWMFMSGKTHTRSQVTNLERRVKNAEQDRDEWIKNAYHNREEIEHSRLRLRLQECCRQTKQYCPEAKFCRRCGKQLIGE